MLVSMIAAKLLLVILVYVSQGCCDSYAWKWTCNETSGLCGRINSFDLELNLTKAYPNQELCRLTCGEQGIVWPKPTSSDFGNKTLVNVDLEDISFNVTNKNPEVQNYLTKVIDYFINIYELESINFIEDYNFNNISENKVCDRESLYKVILTLKADENDTELTWDTDESYSLRIKANDALKQLSILINGKTVYGVRHGVETLSQLINNNQDLACNGGSKFCYSTVKEALIFDKPAYKHRGLLLDTARNYLSIDTIKKNIVAMAMSKMNVLHWHMTDSQSFPFESARVPNLTRYGAYSQKETYKPDDIKSLIEFAKVHGVRIIPEIDSPAHAGNGWQWGPESGDGNMVTCIEWQPWRQFCIQPPCGQMNPINKKLYDVLGLLYADILDLWTNMEAFHMGGDEVDISCWNATQEIVDYLGENNRTESDFLDLWGLFHSKAVQAFDSSSTAKNTSIILWTSTLTDPSYVEKYFSPNRYVIHSWETSTSTIPNQLLKLGYKMIISTKDRWYLDHGFWGSTTYSNWRKVYSNRIPVHKGVLGGEVCSWGELVDDAETEPRVWPRASAAAERLWSNPSSNVTADTVEQRFFLHRERLVSRGIRAGAVTPRYCVEQEGECNKYLE